MDDETDMIATFYDKYGVELGLSGGYEHLDALLPELPGLTVLDAGCGLGDGSRYMAEGGAQVTGIDVSVEEIATATENMETLRLSGRWIFGNHLTSRMPRSTS